MSRVLIRGSNDVGSAIAHCLLHAGYAVLIHDVPAPAVARRRMAFCDALFDGAAMLEGVPGRRVERIADLTEWAAMVGVCGLALHEVLSAWPPDVLIDARMRKRVVPEWQREFAPLVIGVGPNFTAGEQVHRAVESSYGDALGRVITAGSTRALAGEPRSILGYARERFVYAPRAGVLRTEREIGDIVRAGTLLAVLDEQDCCAPLDGAIRGLVRDGVPVEQGAKIIEIDPRGETAQVAGIAERPRRIAEGVLVALRSAVVGRAQEHPRGAPTPPSAPASAP